LAAILEGAARFTRESASLRDVDVADLRDRLIAVLPAREADDRHTDAQMRSAATNPEAVDVARRTSVLLELHRMRRQEEKTGAIDRLDVAKLAAEHGTSVSELQDLLSGMLLEGVIEPHFPTMGEGDMQGAVTLTPLGLAEINRRQ
jgi:hypothetical protein